MIHCDEVFDILTRGPFPTGAPSDGIVEAHLNHCQACRQLAEALRPAIELLQEAIAPEESDMLPCYGGTAPSRPAWTDGGRSPLTTKQLIRRPVVRVASTLRQKTRTWPWRSAAKFVAAACVGLALAGMLRQVVLSRDALGRSAAMPVAVAASWQLPVDGRQWAEQSGLNARCRESVEGYTIAAAAANQPLDEALGLTCCLGCHTARRDPALPANRISSFVLACQACH
ncbi:MAG: hypothetical protein ACREHD_14875 [Pirellulales bacterium]